MSFRTESPTPSIDCCDLHCLVALVEERQLSAAARRLGTTEAGLETAIRRLESAVGVPLVTWHSRACDPTAAGSALAKEARTLVERLAFADADADAHPATGRTSAVRAAPTRVDERLRIIFQTTLEPLFVVDDARRYTRVNEPATELLGAGVYEILGRKIEHFTTPEDRSQLDRLWAQLERDGTLEGAYEVLRGDGSRGRIELRACWGFAPGQHLIAARKLAEPPTDTPAREGGQTLTPREREVLKLAADGRSGPKIAQELVLSPATVKTHLQNIYAKLDAHDRAHAVAKALRCRIIT